VTDISPVVPSLHGRVAVVTGAGRGIGRAIALTLAAGGAAVAVNDRDAEPAAAVAATIERQGGRARSYPISVVDYHETRAMINDVMVGLGPVDILVSNAGVASTGRSLLRTPVEEADQLMRLNAMAALVLCQAVLPGMRDRGTGDIVVVSSTAVDAMSAKSGPYSMAKAALEAMAVTLQKEEGPKGVRVNIVAPGLIDTRLGRHVLGKTLKARLGRPPTDHELTSHLASPAEVADAVYRLVSAPRGRSAGAAGRRTVVGSA